MKAQTKTTAIQQKPPQIQKMLGPSSGHGKTLGANLEGEDFTSNDPSGRTESGGEEEDVDTDEGELSASRSVVGRRSGDTSSSDNVLRDTHTESTNKKNGATTEAVNGPKTREGRDDVDDVGAFLLNESTLSSVALEALEVRSSSERKLVLVVGGDLGELGSNGRVVGGKTAEEKRGVSGSMNMPEQRMIDQANWIARGMRVWEIDCRGAELTIVYQRGDEQTDGDAQLVRTDDETTNPLGQRLGLVHGNLNRDETNTKTSEESTGNEHALLSGSDLQDDTEVERNSSTDDDTPLATSPVGNETSSQSTDEAGEGTISMASQRWMGKEHQPEIVPVSPCCTDLIVRLLEREETHGFVLVRKGSGRLDASYRTGPQTAPAYARHRLTEDDIQNWRPAHGSKVNPIATPACIKPSSKRGA
ncbi:putative transporter, partial [Aureobasidium melanogenum]